MDPLISIIIPTYNRAHLIRETLNCVLAQTYTNWECIIVDDGSTDGTRAIVTDYALNDDRIRLIIRAQNRIKGASSCRNIGLENAYGDFIQFLDSDDLMSDNKLEVQVDFTKHEELIDLVTCKWGRCRNDEKEIYDNFSSYNDFCSIPNFLNSLTTSRGYFPIHAYLIRRDIINKSGPWNELITLNDDGEFMLRVISNSRKIRFAPGPIVLYRVSDKNNVSDYNNIKAVDIAIYSLMLSDAYLAISLNKEHSRFIEWSKGKLYTNVQNSFPELLDKHSLFFNNQIQEAKKQFFFVYRLKNKFKRLFK